PAPTLTHTISLHDALPIFVSEERMLQSIEANPAAACSEFEWRVWPVPYFIAAKFIVHTAGAGLCIQAKCRVIGQSEVNPAAASLELVAAERVQRPVKGNRIAAGFQRRFPA